MESARSVSRMAHPAAPAVMNQATSRNGQSMRPTSISLTPTLMFAIGTTTMADRSEMPGSVAASAGTAAASMIGMKLNCASRYDFA